MLSRTFLVPEASFQSRQGSASDDQRAVVQTRTQRHKPGADYVALLNWVIDGSCGAAG